jgi:hypothetical protein
LLKKGYDTVVKPGGDWLARVQALHAGWFYSWGGDVPPNLPLDIEFVPMIWGFYGNSSRDYLRKRLPAGSATPNSAPLLGFNEPDGKDQANLPVEKALDAWPTLMETGRRLGSPAAVHADGPWMQAFMAEARKRKYRVDFITVHSYMGPNVNGLMGYLDRIHRLYNLPIWITEFAVADWSAKTPETNRFTAPQVEQFMRGVLPALERTPYIERYAWFSFGQKDAAGSPSALFDAQGKLTPLGEIYASFRGRQQPAPR